MSHIVHRRADPPSQPLAAALISALQQLLALHEDMLQQARERERALRAFDMRALAEVIERESALLACVVEQDRRRAEAVEQLAQAHGVAAPPGASLTVRDVAPLVAPPARTQLLTVAAALRERIEQLHELNQALAQAAERLEKHMQGLLREAAAKLNHSGAYSDRGVVDAGPPVVSALDLTS
ncbi:MAG: flagellar protein FlgN [Planctomycetota bacterium]|nr:MAG: flagellar protein FlgN [Planctomycetota bacterium]